MNRLDTPTPPHTTTAPSGPGWPQPRGPAPWTGRPINVGQAERQLSVLGGAALVGLGLLRGRLSGIALAGLGVAAIRRGLAGHCRLYERFDINTAAHDAPDPSALYDRGVKILETITVNKPARALYDFWLDFANQPKFMPNVEAVRPDNGGRSHWRLKGPGGVVVEYEAEVINEEPPHLIAWRSVGGADVQHAGSVRFVDRGDGRGTEVRVNVEYLPPAGFVGQFGAHVLRLLGQEPAADVRRGLRNFKQLMETGELISSEPE